MTDATRRKAGYSERRSSNAKTIGHKKRTFVMTPLAAAVVAALYPVSPALAQQDERIEEITVTATKREMNLQDVGQSINVLTTADIEKQAFRGMEDFMRSLPSVGLVNSMPGRNSIVMRGIGTGANEFYTDSQVAVYLDEQPMSTISQQLDVAMIDIARIEVLPGPQGTLFGSSSQSGTLRIITNQPVLDSFSSQVDAGIGTTKGGGESYDFSGWVNIPLVEDKFAIRLVGYYSQEGGYVDNVLGPSLEGSIDNAAFVEEDQNEYDLYGGRIMARWRISEDWELDASLIQQTGEANGTWDTDPALGDFKVTRFFDEFRDDKWYQASATIRGDLGFAELTATASYFDRDILYIWDNMDYEQWKDAYYGVYLGYDLYNSDYTIGSTFNDQYTYRSAYEVRLTSQGESRFQWMIGGFYEDFHNNWFYGAENPDYVGTTSWYQAQIYAYYANYYGYDVQYPLPPTTIGYSEIYDNRVTQTAVFGEISYDLTDRWSASFGARWFEYDRDSILIYSFPEGLPPFGQEDTLGREDTSGVDSDSLIKIGTKFNVTDDVMVYALYSEGFRLGGNNSPRAAGTGIVPLTYEPDQLENIEVGMKSKFANGRVVLNVTAFDMEWDQIQVNESGIDFNGFQRWWLRGTINGGKGENKGAEVYSTWQATDNLHFEALAYFGNAEYTEDIPRPGFSGTIPAGTPMPWAPDEKYKFAVEYTFRDVLGGDLWFRYDYMYEGDRWRDVDDAIAPVNLNGFVPSWDLSNVHVGLTMDNGWELTLSARNVFDDLATNSVEIWDYGVFFGDPRFNVYRSYATPRTVSFNIRKRFN